MDGVQPITARKTIGPSILKTIIWKETTAFFYFITTRLVKPFVKGFRYKPNGKLGIEWDWAKICFTIVLLIANIIFFYYTKKPIPFIAGTIWVNKSGADMNVGETEKGAENNYFTYNASGWVDAWWHRENTYNAWLYALGVTLTQGDSFFIKFEFTTPSNLGLSAGQPYDVWGLVNNGSSSMLISTDNLTLYHNQGGTGPGDMYGRIEETDGTAHEQFAISYQYVINTDYYITLIHDSAIDDFTATLYTASDDIVRATTSLTTTGWTWAVDMVGIGNFKYATNNGLWNNPANVTRIKANSGTTEEFATTPTVTVQAATSITTHSFTANGNITATGGTNATVRGFEYGLTEIATWTESESGDFGTGAYTLPISALDEETVYHIRAFATNPSGTGYSTWTTVTTYGTGGSSLALTAKWKMTTDMAANTRQAPIRCIWKRGVRIKAADTAIFDGSSAVNYGGSNEFSIGIHIRLEDAFGGHGTTRLIAHQYSGGKGWKITYNVGNAQLDFYVDDGAGNTATISVDIDEEDISWWMFSFFPGKGADGFAVYKADQLQGIADTTAIGNIHSGTNILLGDGTNTVAMMFGGFFLMNSEITQADIDKIVADKDTVWYATIAGTLNLHVPGFSHDWGGGIGVDVDESAAQWKDISGNGFDLDFTLNDSTNSMARMAARKTSVVTGALDTLTFTRHGSQLSMKISEGDTINVGDVIILYMPSNKWSGYVEKLKKGVGGKIVKAIGLDEESTIPFRNDVFADREQQEKDITEDDTNMIYTGTDGAGEAGSMFISLNPKISILNDALRNDYGYREGYISQWFGANTVWELGINDFQLIEREESVKDSASEVNVYGYSNVNIPKKETFAGPLDDLTLANKPVEIIQVEDSTDGILYAGYRVDGDNKKMYFDATTTANILVDYTIRDTNTATASDSDVEEEIGKKKKLNIWVGYIGDTPLQAFADAMIRGKYWVITVRPNGRKFYNKSWYVGQKIRINMSTDHFGINGYYFITKVTFEGSIHSVPKIEMEEYETGSPLPFVYQAKSMTDIINRMNETNQQSFSGFYQ